MVSVDILYLHSVLPVCLRLCSGGQFGPGVTHLRKPLSSPSSKTKFRKQIPIKLQTNTNQNTNKYNQNTNKYHADVNQYNLTSKQIQPIYKKYHSDVNKYHLK